MLNKNDKNEDKIEMQGVVMGSSHGIFKIKSPSCAEEITASISGKMRINSIKILNGDSVVVEVSKFEPTRGRIVQRLR